MTVVLALPEPLLSSVHSNEYLSHEIIEAESPIVYAGLEALLGDLDESSSVNSDISDSSSTFDENSKSHSWVEDDYWQDNEYGLGENDSIKLFRRRPALSSQPKNNVGRDNHTLSEQDTLSSMKAASVLESNHSNEDDNDHPLDNECQNTPIRRRCRCKNMAENVGSVVYSNSVEETDFSFWAYAEIIVPLKE